MAHITTPDGVHVFDFQEGECLLHVSEVAPDRQGRLWATVKVECQGALLNAARIDFLRIPDRASFAAVCGSRNGTSADEWDRRLVSCIEALKRQPTSPNAATSTPVVADQFPRDVFPSIIRDFIRVCAQALPCPPDFLAVPMLSVLGAAIGTTHQLEVKPGWCESARIWTAVVADPGSKKSPALDRVARPLYQQQRLQEEHTRQQREYEAQEAEYQKTLGSWKKNTHASPDDLPPAPDAPMFAQVFSTDSTLEGLAAILEGNPRGILFLRDELTAWARAMNQYRGGRGADSQHWLSFWNGAPVLINRKSRPVPIALHNPFVCVTGAMPPDVLTDLSGEHGREDGFVHRILFALPETAPLAWTEQHIPAPLQKAYADVIAKLYALTPTIDASGEETPVTLGLSTQARATLIEWAWTHYAEMNSPDLAPRLRGPWAKMEGYCVRLALLLFLTRHVCGEVRGTAIDEEAVLGAAALIDYELIAS